MATASLRLNDLYLETAASSFHLTTKHSLPIDLRLHAFGNPTTTSTSTSTPSTVNFSFHETEKHYWLSPETISDSAFRKTTATISVDRAELESKDGHEAARGLLSTMGYVEEINGRDKMEEWIGAIAYFASVGCYLDGGMDLWFLVEISVDKIYDDNAQLSLCSMSLTVDDSEDEIECYDDEELEEPVFDDEIDCEEEQVMQFD